MTNIKQRIKDLNDDPKELQNEGYCAHCVT